METWLSQAPPWILALLLSIPAVRGHCPTPCSCSGNNRIADCSGRNLTLLPLGLQDNLTSLNLSHNHFADLNHQLTHFANLRTLDISNNRLPKLPEGLPRSLWEIHAAGNNIKVLQKLDTAYQWNLKVLDVSRNMVERAILINNTLSSLQYLNLSSNKLWTVPTNIPYNTEIVDLANNFLTQILPGTLERHVQLRQLYLHSNKFTTIPDRAFNQLARLQVITLYNNPWSCEDGKQALSYLEEWLGRTNATVIGSPCSVEATTPWKDAMPFSVPPAAAEERLLGKAMKAAATDESPVASEQLELVHPQWRTKEVTLNAAAGQTIALAGTDKPFVALPEDLRTETHSSYEAAAATQAIYIQDPASMNTTSTMGLAGSPTTPMTLSITSGMPTNYSRRPPSTTVAGKKKEAPTHVKGLSPSNGPRVYSVFIATLIAAALAAG